MELPMVILFGPYLYDSISVAYLSPRPMLPLFPRRFFLLLPDRGVPSLLLPGEAALLSSVLFCSALPVWAGVVSVAGVTGEVGERGERGFCQTAET